MIISARHRSYALALRHLAALRRQHPKASVEIISRRNASGKFSKRGIYYQFEVIEHEPIGKLELVLHFDYGGSKATDLIRFQVHITAPGDTDDEEALRIVRDHYTPREKESWPKGWKETKIFWGHARGDGDVHREFDPEDERQRYLRRLALGGEAKIARKSAIKTRGNSRKKKKRKSKK